MQTEIEATFINVSHDVLREKLKTLGATLIHPERAMRRTNFDYEDLRLDSQAAWVRLRDEGSGNITLTFKQRTDETIDGMKEIEIHVDDYEKTKSILLAIGLVIKSEQETKRETWRLHGTSITLDTWPWLDPIVEIEGVAEEAVRHAAAQLGLAWDKAVFDSADRYYQFVFDVTRTEISTCPILFGPIPDWLEKRRKNIGT